MKTRKPKEGSLMRLHYVQEMEGHQVRRWATYRLYALKRIRGRKQAVRGMKSAFNSVPGHVVNGLSPAILTREIRKMRTRLLKKPTRRNDKERP